MAATSTHHQYNDDVEENNDAAQVGVEDSATNSVPSEGKGKHQALNQPGAWGPKYGLGPVETMMAGQPFQC